jgi:hypothetical protein
MHWTAAIWAPNPEALVPVKLKKKACRADRLARMLAAAKGSTKEERMALRWLAMDCERCGRCKMMPPPM